MKKIILLLAFFLTATAWSQTQPFWNEVQTIKKYDQQFGFPPRPILFVGSSSIRMWNSLQVSFGEYNVLNRGIGGAVFGDVTNYLEDIVFPYNPRQIVIYAENDLPDESASAQIILERFKTLYNGIRAKMPDVPIAYISMKPSPSRDKFRQKAIDSNKLIKDFLANEKNTAYIDIFTPMMKNGNSRPELFVQDMLHMNADGYAIWENAVRPYLLKPAKK